MQPDEPVRHRVKRAAHHPPGIRRHPAGQHAGPFYHLARRPPREREQQQLFGRDALREQPGNPCAQSRRLAGSCPRQNQQRVAVVRCGGPLLLVEVGEPGVRRARLLALRRLTRVTLVVEHLFA